MSVSTWIAGLRCHSGFAVIGEESCCRCRSETTGGLVLTLAAHQKGLAPWSMFLLVPPVAVCQKAMDPAVCLLSDGGPPLMRDLIKGFAEVKQHVCLRLLL